MIIVGSIGKMVGCKVVGRVECSMKGSTGTGFNSIGVRLGRYMPVRCKYVN